jgi:uncharacterized membrane protein
MTTSLALLGVLILAIMALVIAIMDAKLARDQVASLEREADIWMEHAMRAADQRDAAVHLAQSVLQSPPPRVSMGPGMGRVGEC